MSTSKMGFSEGVGVNIATYTFMEDGVTKHMERIAPGAAVLSAFDDTATVSAVGLVSGFSAVCTGKGRIILGVKAVTTPSDYCSFRFIFKNDSDVVIGTSILLQSVFTEVTSGGSPDYRYGTVTVMGNDCCASTVEVYVVTLSANGSMVLSLGAV